MTLTGYRTAAAVLVALALATPAVAKMPADEVKAAIEREYGVRVLRIVEVERAGGTVYAVTVMNPGGDFDEAFQVNTLAVDPDTGALILQDRPGPGAGMPRNIDEGYGAAMRRDSARGR